MLITKRNLSSETIILDSINKSLLRARHCGKHVIEIIPFSHPNRGKTWALLFTALLIRKLKFRKDRHLVLAKISSLIPSLSLSSPPQPLDSISLYFSLFSTVALPISWSWGWAIGSQVPFLKTNQTLSSAEPSTAGLPSQKMLLCEKFACRKHANYVAQCMATL